MLMKSTAESRGPAKVDLDTFAYTGRPPWSKPWSKAGPECVYGTGKVVWPARLGRLSDSSG